MKQIDLCGLLCPEPLIRAKRALKESSAEEIIEFVTDNEIAHCNIRDYFTELDIPVEIRHEQNKYYFRIKNKAIISDIMPELYCQPAGTQPEKKYTVVIKDDKMGAGDKDLGHILLRAFINTLKEAPHLPAHIVLYNQGIMVALENTDTAQSLIELEELGVTIVVCGTCVEFYGVKNQLAVGMISNMYKIVQILTSSDSIIYP